MNCTLSFESDAELEEHMLSGLHTVPKSLTSLDKVRNSFVHKMKITSQLNMPISSSSNSASVKDKSHCMNIFLLQGWALPVRSSFRFSNQQKELLYKYFIRGEESGNKMSLEQVHMQLRRELPPDQYVTSQQIRSLFSRFSNLKRKGKLVEPTTENNENSQVNNNKEVYGKNDDFNLTGDNEDDNKYEEDIANLAKEICLVWKVNDCVAVAYEKQWNIEYYGGGVAMHDCGLFLDRDIPFIGGSPNRIVTCLCCPPACLEVKCPFFINYLSPLDPSVKPSYLIKNNVEPSFNCLKNLDIAEPHAKSYFSKGKPNNNTKN
nr:uncharacterized protein LOC124817114 [Hydra vulgaris]